MDIAVYCNNQALQKKEFHSEEEFEKEVKVNHKRLFGEKTIYLDIKRRIDSLSLGGAIPDGILIDLEDPEDINFYLVEVELAKHNFYEHIFPQITKFFAFYKNPESRDRLISKICDFIDENSHIRNEFEKLLGRSEIYRAVKNAVENNGRILLVIDNEKPEIEEAQRIYTDTWSKLVIPEILHKYISSENTVFTMKPSFLEKELIIEAEESEKEPDKQVIYTENYHLEDANSQVVSIYGIIKNKMITLNSNIIFNPQKYYISIKEKRNFAYLDIKRKKIKIAVMLPLERGREILKTHKIRQFTEGIQRFYSHPSFEVTIEDENNFEEIYRVLEEAYKNQ